MRGRKQKTVYRGRRAGVTVGSKVGETETGDARGDAVAGKEDGWREGKQIHYMEEGG